MRLRDIMTIRRSVPKDTRAEIVTEWHKTSIDRIRVSSWVAFAVYGLLLIVDIERDQSGLALYDELPYQLLSYVHFMGALFLPIGLSTSLFMRYIRESLLYRRFVVYSFLSVMTIAVYSNAILSYMVSGSLVLYVGFIMMSMWAMSMTFRQRVLFSVLSLLIMLFFIIAPPDELLRHQVIGDTKVASTINVFEATFMTMVAFIFAMYDEGYRLLNYFNRWQLADDKSRLEKLERTRSHLLANIAHEFRTPLTVISGLTNQLIANDENVESTRLKMIENNAGRMLELVSQILTVSKLEEGALALNIKREHFGAFMEYVEDCFQGQAHASGVELTFEVPYLELYLEFDREVLFRVLANLISNAIHYTPAGGEVTLHVDVETEGKTDRINFIVRDNGIGISQKDLPHIFERYYRSDGTSIVPGDGSGIGLSMVKELVQVMNGDVTVESELGVGTTFKLTIPLTAAETTTMPGVEESSGSFKLNSTSLEASEDEFAVDEISKGTVLVVEDNRDVNELITSCLVPDFQVIQAYDGISGELLTQDLLPDLVISDIRMPRKDGLDLCRSLRNSELTSHIPVFLLTAISDDDIKTKGLEAGAMDIIAKPFKPDELLARVTNIMRLRENLQSKFADADWASNQQPGSPEEEFVFNVRKAVVDRINDSEFRVTDLCRSIGMSRTQLHNKLKALTAKSTTAFIRDVRLSEARKLLLSEGLTISEIAYDVGFADPSYFSRVFTGVFGMSPSEFRQKETSPQ